MIKFAIPPMKVSDPSSDGPSVTVYFTSVSPENNQPVLYST